MNIVYTLETGRKNVKSVFLAGPSHRDFSKKSWREDAIKIFEEVNLDVDVFIPEPRDGKSPAEWTYSRQVSWEVEHLKKATTIIFWIPRNLETLPGFTTNIEFGEWLHSDKIVVGAPKDAEKNRYLRERCDRLKIPWMTSLEACVKMTLNEINREDEMEEFWTADTHFGQQRVLELSLRPFDNAEEMSWTMVKNWNSVVADKDFVYHLGDFGDPSYIKHLKGKKIFLLPGNYDTPEVLAKLKEDPRVCIIGTNWTKSLGGKDIGMTHAPEDAANSNFTLFGHIHKLQMVKTNGLNVGVDCHNFTPINATTVLFYMNAIQNHYDENVFMSSLGCNTNKKESK